MNRYATGIILAGAVMLVWVAFSTNRFVTNSLSVLSSLGLVFAIIDIYYFKTKNFRTLSSKDQKSTIFGIGVSVIFIILLVIVYWLNWTSNQKAISAFGNVSTICAIAIYIAWKVEQFRINKRQKPKRSLK